MGAYTKPIRDLRKIRSETERENIYEQVDDEATKELKRQNGVVIITKRNKE